MKDFIQAYFGSKGKTIGTVVLTLLFVALIISAMWPMKVAHFADIDFTAYEYPTRWVAIGLAFVKGLFLTSRYWSYRWNITNYERSCAVADLGHRELNIGDLREELKVAYDGAYELETQINEQNDELRDYQVDLEQLARRNDVLLTAVRNLQGKNTVLNEELAQRKEIVPLHAPKGALAASATTAYYQGRSDEREGLPSRV